MLYALCRRASVLRLCISREGERGGEGLGMGRLRLLTLSANPNPNPEPTRTPTRALLPNLTRPCLAEEQLFLSWFQQKRPTILESSIVGYRTRTRCRPWPVRSALLAGRESPPLPGPGRTTDISHVSATSETGNGYAESTL